MHIISYRRLHEFNQRHQDSLVPLDNWYRSATLANWQNLIEVQSVFPQAEAVGNFTVFNIKSNKYCLII